MEFSQARNLQDTLEGTRSLDRQSEKQSPVDFAIWKKASPEHIMRWPSPWGMGFLDGIWSALP